MTRQQTKPSNQPLTCEVKGGRLVISIGVGMIGMIADRPDINDGSLAVMVRQAIVSEATTKEPRGLNKLIADAIHSALETV